MINELKLKTTKNKIFVIQGIQFA